jgi:hypothetical protein
MDGDSDEHISGNRTPPTRRANFGRMADTRVFAVLLMCRVMGYLRGEVEKSEW